MKHYELSTVNKYFKLDASTGDLYWKERSALDFTTTGSRSAQGCANNWNSRYANKKCLTSIGNHGYKNGNYIGKTVLAHRIVFLIVNGYLPEYVDHINGDRLDNRPENLREITSSGNIANSKARVGSKSKYLGVGWSSSHGKWVANITNNGKAKYIGIYECERQAAINYNRWAKKLHGKYARLNNVDIED